MKYYAIRVEFQVRGSPHIHSFFWVLNAPILTKDTIEDYTRFVVGAYIPDPNDNPDIYKLVTTYQIHLHSKSCRKYKNTNCRYDFGRYFTSHTIVAVPLSLLIRGIKLCNNVRPYYARLKNTLTKI